MEYLRTSLIPGLLIACDFNLKNGNPNLRFFELASVHKKIGDNKNSLKSIRELKFLTGIFLDKSYNFTSAIKFILRKYLYSHQHIDL